MDNMKLSRIESQGSIFHHYLTGLIGEPDDFIGLLTDLETASPQDIIYIHINSQGGSLETVAQILHAMENTQGQVVTSAEGVVASGASLVFFAGHGLAVGTYGYFLLHDGATTEFGKVSDNYDAAKASKEWISKIYHKVYSPFFKKKEIKKVLNGKEWYLSSEEVEARIQKAYEENNIED